MSDLVARLRHSLSSDETPAENEEEQARAEAVERSIGGGGSAEKIPIVDLTKEEGICLDKLHVLVKSATGLLAQAPVGVASKLAAVSSRVTVEVKDHGCGGAGSFETRAVAGDEVSWTQHAMLVYRRKEGSGAGSLVVKLRVKTSTGRSRTLQAEVDIPPFGAEDGGKRSWTHVSVPLDGDACQVSLSLRPEPAEFRLVSRERYMKMETEELQHRKLELRGGEQASVSWKRTEGNTKCVFWIPGRNDYFHHPHALDMLAEEGFDLYTIDLRRCGRGKPEGFNQLHAHHCANFSEYREEIDLAIEHAERQGRYEKRVMYGHSTGGLVVSMYIREGKYENLMNGYLFNAPFFAWNVGGAAKAYINLRTKTQGTSYKSDDLSPLTGGHGGQINTDLMGIWTQYYYESGKRNPFNLDLTTGWVAGVTDAQKSLKRMKPINKPVCILTSRADRTLSSQALLEQVDHVSLFRTEIEVTHARHDVLLSPFKETADECLGFMRTWLKNNISSSAWPAEEAAGPGAGAALDASPPDDLSQLPPCG